MTFSEALAAVFNSDARITRRTWNNRAIYCYMEQSQLCIRGFNREGDTLPHPWTITDEDYFADDWEVVE